MRGTVIVIGFEIFLTTEI